MAIVRENERKKEYLKGYIYSIRKAQRLKEQIGELRSQQMFPSVNHDGMPQGNAHSDLSGYVARLDALISSWSRSRLWRYGSTRKSMTGYIKCRTGRRRKC